MGGTGAGPGAAGSKPGPGARPGAAGAEAAAAAPLYDLHAARAICEGRHGDPFAFLGPHRVGDALVLRVLMPGADGVALLQQGQARALAPQPDLPGLFTGPLAPGPYTLRGTAGAAVWEWDDPYRFGPVLGQMDEYFIGEGTHRRLWKVLGAAPVTHEGVAGLRFAVWAPNAERVSVVGDFNIWDGRRHVMRRRGATGVWELFLPGLTEGTAYKYEIRANGGAILPLKADPVGFGSEHPPRTASVVRRIDRHPWRDGAWMEGRAAAQDVNAPVSIYEVHLPSWRRAEGGRPLSYLELADRLIPYVQEMGFTHIECLPLSEHPFDGSWGYQPIGLYAPTIRMGTPEELQAFIDRAHQAGIGVILDWVPGHFPDDAHGLARFDGTALYEHADPREGFQQDWNTLIYNFGRREVANFLIANALYWLEEFHVDGLRVDAVASMLYRDYSRRAGEWIPNRDGGRENYEAIDLLRRMNRVTYGEVPGILTVAEESTAFPGVSHPVDRGGLGFGFKWNMGWMNDSLRYMGLDPVHRKYHHNLMTFALVYAFSENFVLPLSHDEVVHGKGSLIARMPGDGWQKFANLRAYLGFMWGHPGKKLLFMGQEFAQGREWSHARELDWFQLDLPQHRGVQALVKELNRLYRSQPALHRHDCRPEGFRWLDADNAEASIYAWLRQGGAGEPRVAVVANMTPVPRRGYRLGLPADPGAAGRWRVALNTDAADYGGSGSGSGADAPGLLSAQPVPLMGQPASVVLDLPPLGTLFLIEEPEEGAR